MKTNIKTAVVVAAMFQMPAMISPGPGVAQAPEGSALAEKTQLRRVTLDEALGLLGSNLELRMARSAAVRAEAMARQSGAYSNPAFTASHEALDESGLAASESYFTLSQRIEWPGARDARRAVSNENVLAARSRVMADSVTLAFRVKRAYVEAARAERHGEILERVTAVFRQAAESAGERYQEGDVSLYDLRRIEVERVRYEASLADALLVLNASRRQLALLVAPETGELQLAPSDPPVGIPPPIDLNQLQALALGRRPEVLALEAGVRSAEAERRGMRAQRVPELTATGGFKRQSNGFNGLFLGMSVPVPLWNRSSGAIEAADALVMEKETLLVFTRKEIEQDASRALDVYSSQVRRSELLSNRNEQSRVDLLDVAQVAYDAGEMELIGLLDAAEALSDAETATLRIQSEVWISYYDLERAVGGFGGLAGQGEDDA